MKIRKTVQYLLFTGILSLFSSCEKDSDTFSSDKLVLKSQEITAYIYEEYNGMADYTAVVPVKLYARGGTPEHSSGDYRFRLAEDSVLPEGLTLDSISGVLQGNGKRLMADNTVEEFMIEVTDGIKTAMAKYTFNKIYVNKEDKFELPVMQFCAPETNLRIDLKSGFYGVSLTMLGGKPPYKFALPDKETLPAGLTLNPDNGVISGGVNQLTPGAYTFRISCTDSDGTSALSLCTAQRFEEYTLIVK